MTSLSISASSTIALRPAATNNGGKGGIAVGEVENLSEARNMALLGCEVRSTHTHTQREKESMEVMMTDQRILVRSGSEVVVFEVG